MALEARELACKAAAEGVASGKGGFADGETDRM